MVDVVRDLLVARAVVELSLSFRYVLGGWEYNPFASLVRGKDGDGSVLAEAVEFLGFGRAEVGGWEAGGALKKAGVHSGLYPATRGLE